MGILSILLSLVCLGTVIVWIMILIKMFQTEGALKGILGLICSLYAFIWGWMNANKLNIKNLMFIWTGLIVLMFILYVFVGAAFMSNLPTTPTTP